MTGATVPVISRRISGLDETILKTLDFPGDLWYDNGNVSTTKEGMVTIESETEKPEGGRQRRKGE